MKALSYNFKTGLKWIESIISYYVIFYYMIYNVL